MAHLKDLLVLGAARFINVIKGTTTKAQNGCYYCTCSTAAGTAAKVLTCDDDQFALQTGTVIAVKFSASNTASNVTLNVNGTGAKSIWYNNAVYTSTSNEVCGYANRPAYYLYDGTYWVYLASSNTYNSNTYDRTYLSNTGYKAGSSAIVAANIIVAGSDGLYKHLKSGTAFDITMPILYASSACNANATNNGGYLIIPFTVTTTQSITLTAHLPVYIKGQLSGTTFTPVGTAPLTQTVPTTADGYEYMLLGKANTTTVMYLLPEHPIYAYRNGKFGLVTNDSDSVNGHTVAVDVPSGAKFTDTTYSGFGHISLNGTTFSHVDSGVTAGSKGHILTYPVLEFGTPFKTVGGTVDSAGHLTDFREFELTIPSTHASASAPGLMSQSDKVKLDSIKWTLHNSVTDIGLTVGSCSIVQAFDAMTNNSILICDAGNFTATSVPYTTGLVKIIKQGSSRWDISFHPKNSNAADYHMYPLSGENGPSGVWSSDGTIPGFWSYNGSLTNYTDYSTNCWRVGDNGYLYLNVVFTSYTNGTLIGTMLKPRPIMQLDFNVIPNAGANGPYLRLKTNGEVYLYGFTASTHKGVRALISFPCSTEHPNYAM